MTHILLHELPAEHPLRNAPLAGVELRNRQSKEWRLIGRQWGIGGHSYNQIGQHWRDLYDFRVEA